MTTKHTVPTMLIKMRTTPAGWPTEQAPEIPGAMLQELRQPIEADRITLVHTSRYVEDYDTKWGEYDNSDWYNDSVITVTLTGELNKRVSIQVNDGSPIEHGYLAPGVVVWHAFEWGTSLTGDDTVTVRIDGKPTILKMAQPKAQANGTVHWTSAQLA